MTLTQEELAMLEEAERRPIVYDEDCPKLTPEQLAQFKPVHYTVMEERKQAVKDTGLSPEQIERIKAAQKRHSAIDPGCEKLTPEEFINWHPVGGISWEERAQRMKEKLRENKIILLNSSGSLGHLPGTIELSLEVARWFAGFLGETISNDTHRAETKTYEAKKDSSGNVTFTEIRKGGFASDLVFFFWRNSRYFNRNTSQNEGY